MSGHLRDYVEASGFSPSQIIAKTQRIYDAVLGESPYLDSGNFTTIDTSDLKRLCDHYDASFFMGQIDKTLGNTPLRFRLSKRMTKAGGRTTQYLPATPAGCFSLEISVSTLLLFQCFTGDDHRPITVTGIKCGDRMEALQRIIEHELVHLIEILLWKTSSCSGERFRSIASRFFTHTTHTHELITPAERAFAKYGITLGDRVRFPFEGGLYTGIVNRVTKRATVLVRNRRGLLHTDGNRYLTFYVPVELLEALPAGRSHE